MDSTSSASVAARARARVQVWLKQPLVRLADITTRHDVVEALSSDPELRERLRDLHLRGAHRTMTSAQVPVHGVAGAVQMPFMCAALHHAACIGRRTLLLLHRSSMLRALHKQQTLLSAYVPACVHAGRGVCSGVLR